MQCIIYFIFLNQYFIINHTNFRIVFTILIFIVIVSSIYDVSSQYFFANSTKVSDKSICLETKNGIMGINEKESKSSITKDEGKILYILAHKI